MENQESRRDCQKTLNRVFSHTEVINFTISEFSKTATFGLFRQSRKKLSENLLRTPLTKSEAYTISEVDDYGNLV